MLGQEGGSFYILREVWGLGRGILRLRRRHGRLGRGARGVLCAREEPGAVGMYSGGGGGSKAIVDGLNGLQAQGAWGAGTRCAVMMVVVCGHSAF